MSMAEERHPTEDLPAYVLGALDEAERLALAAHLETCDQCAHDLARFEDALYGAAAVGAVRADPPRDLRARIVLRHRGARVAPSSDLGGRVREWLARPLPLAVPLALAVRLVVSFVAVSPARREAATYAPAPASVADGGVVGPAPQKNPPADPRRAPARRRTCGAYV